MLNDLWTQVIAWSGALVTPDWGALVALIPLFLLLVVAAFLAITGAKWAAIGPLDVGSPRRRLPLTPDGRPLRSHAVGPLVVAAGVFVLAFGGLAGAGWFAAGAITVAAGVAVWAAQVQHLPGLSLPQVSRARLGLFGGIAVLALVLVATAKVEPDLPGSAASVAAQGSGASSGAVPAADATLTARGIAFLEPALAAPAGRPFTVAFDNRDSVPHNLEIRDANGSVVFRGDFVTGPVVKVYDVPTLPAGAYQFICTIHPAMTGTLTAK
jgi:plastocyanin